ncbi:hypothetical protein JCM8097_009390 [Rhodosporidiobolus ruineniae]
MPSLRVLKHSALSKCSNDFPPLPLLNLSPYSRLDPRSLKLTRMVFSGAGAVCSASYRNFFAACSNSLTSFQLTAETIPSSFLDDLALLPPSLQSLTLCFGRSCPNAHSNPPFPQLDDLPPSFPKLENLSLYSNVLRQIESLTELTQLKSLHLGFHACWTPSGLTALLPPALPHLKTLTANLCICPAETAPSNTLHLPGQRPWKPLPKKEENPCLTDWLRDTEELLRAADRVGVDVEGSLRCEIGMCRVGPGHKKWCVGGGI